MNKFIILYFFIGLFILPCHIFAQEKQLIITSDIQYEYADQLYLKKDYEPSMVEFKRFVYFFKKDKRQDKAIFKIGMCLFELKKYYEAAKVFNDIIIKDLQNKTEKESVFMQSKAFEKIQNFGYAQIVLQNYLKLTKDTQTKDRIYFNIARIHFDMAKKNKSGALKKAKHYLAQISPLSAVLYNTKKYADLITKVEQAPKKNPNTAGLLAIIPGAGFLYSERYKDALITFGLNIGLMYAAYEAFENNNPALGTIIGFVEAGFYTGSIYGSVSSAHKYNKAQKLKIMNHDFSVHYSIDPVNQAYLFSLKYNF